MIPIILVGAAYLIGKTMNNETFNNGGKVPLLAPNGLPSKLTPEQWHLVRTPEFKAWFGDWEKNPKKASKVVDNKTKEPLVVYHGTNAKFTIFDTDEDSKNRHGGVWSADYPDGYIFMISDKKEAKYYGTRIIPLFVNMKYPTIKKVGKGENLVLSFDDEGLAYEGDAIVTDGIDYIIGTQDEFAVKLADGTNTTFDGSNPDIRYGKGGEITDWDVEFTGGSLKGQKLSEQEIEFIDVYSDNIYSLTFTNDSQFYAKTIEVIGLLSITNNVVKISVIFDNDKWKDQKVIRKLQKMANDSNRVIVNNNSKLRSEKSLFPFLLVSKKDADNYDIASQFIGKLDTPKKAMTKSFVQDFIDSGDYVEQIKKGRDVKGVIEQIKKYGLEVPQEILSLIKK